MCQLFTSDFLPSDGASTTGNLGSSTDTTRATDEEHGNARHESDNDPVADDLEPPLTGNVCSAGTFLAKFKGRVVT